ncbi:MAG: GNAT family N-acetyltransferase [Microthrixaceae bacterium]
MLTRETITVGRQRFRVSPWHSQQGVALLTMPANHAVPSTTEVSCALEAVRSRGCRNVMTSALSESETAAFRELGFRELDRLHVLERRLGDRPLRAEARAGVHLRRGRRTDRRVALGIDARAFPEFWRLDSRGLSDAKGATPSSRFRIAEIDGGAVGYSVTGRGGSSGFLQRLATDPDHQRSGIGSALVLDALDWCARRGCERVLVNTQVTNGAALGLYRSLGFVRLPDDLVVLSWSGT